MKKRNTLLILGALLSSVGLAACSSSMDTKGKGIAQLMNDNQERVFYSVIDSNHDSLPGKDERVNYVYITKGGKLNGYEIGGGTVGAAVELYMDDVVGKNINEVKKLAEMYSMTDEGVRSRISVEDLRGELSIQKTVEFLKENNLVAKL